MTADFRIGTTLRGVSAPKGLVLHAEAMAGHLEELAERVDLIRDELWRLRAQLGQGVEQ